MRTSRSPNSVMGAIGVIAAVRPRVDVRLDRLGLGRRKLRDGFIASCAPKASRVTVSLPPCTKTTICALRAASTAATIPAASFSAEGGPATTRAYPDCPVDMTLSDCDSSPHHICSD